MTLKYDIATREGKQVSVSVFGLGEPLVATADHPNFGRIVQSLTGDPTNEKDLKALFDVGNAIHNKFMELSERVKFMHGKLYFDGVETHNVLTEKIVAFYMSGEENFQPLVNFMEKIATNPNEHSREHLFVWLARNNFHIAPDGDIIAYKGVDQSSGQYRSRTSGEAIVNNEWKKGKIPNVPGTIIEMPRDKVQHDPGNACSVGLHCANYHFAKGFASVVVQVKINPRDVVSVPTYDAEKMRVCRYKVLQEVHGEDKTLLWAGAAPTKRVEPEPKPAPEPTAEAEPKPKRARRNDPPAKKAKVQAKAEAKKVEEAKPYEFPELYENFTRKDWNRPEVTLKEMKMVAKDWEIKGYSKMDRPTLLPILLKEAKARKATWPTTA